MSRLRRGVLRLLHTAWPARGEAEAEREISAHRALIEDECARRGLSPADARREARRLLGGPLHVRSRHRDARACRWAIEATHDVAHAVRMLRRAPGFTGAVLVTIALAVAAATSVSAVVYGALLRPLPYPDADRLVRMWEEHDGATPVFPGAHLSNLTWHAWHDAGLGPVEELGAFEYRAHTLTGLAQTERLDGAGLTPSLTRVLRLSPAAGRLFVDDDVEGGEQPVVVLTHGFWRSHFGGDVSAIGRSLVLDGVGREIVGVGPAGFVFPHADVAVYTPYAVKRPAGNAMGITNVLGRLRLGATAGHAASEATALARATERPMVADVMFGKGGPVHVYAQPMAAQMTARVRPALLTLAAAVALLLLVACANVANLFLAHGAGRGQELSVRASLGATRGRLLRQLLTESLGLSMVGGALGMTAGAALLRLLPRLAPDTFPRLDAVYMDWPSALAALLAMSIVGVGGAAMATRQPTRQTVTPRGTGSRTVAGAPSTLRSSLLVLEASLAVLLLVGAALLLRSFSTLMRVDAGYESAQVVTATMYLPASADRLARATALSGNLLERLRSMPAILEAGIGSMAPFSGAVGRFGFELPGTVTPGGKPVVAYALYSAVTEGYVEALGMRLLEGRTIERPDRTAAVRTMLVNQTFARTYLQDGRPAVGRQYTGMLGDDDTVVEIVGVVADVLPIRLDAEPQPHIYLAEGGPFGFRQMSLVVRTTGTTPALLTDIRAVVHGVEPEAALERLARLDDRRAASVATPRLIMLVLATLALLALSLAAAGLYGVLSHLVTARSRELGIRAALGARRATLLVMVLRQGLGVTTIGLGLGLCAAVVFARALRSQLFGIQPLDPVAFVVAPLLLIVAATFACLMPARRAAASNPADILRAQ